MKKNINSLITLRIQNNRLILLITTVFVLSLSGIAVLNLTRGIQINSIVLAQEVNCTEDTWACVDWSQCSVDGQQTRTCTLTNDCPSVYTPQPQTTQSCTPACTQDTWTCAEWSQCSSNGQQTRSCTIANDCSLVDTHSPPNSQSFTPSCTQVT